MTVIWSDEATNEYFENIEYLMTKWSEKSAAEFIADLESIIELIKIHPELYPLSGYGTIRRAVVRQQITVFYRVREDRIEILRVWNNYKDPTKRDF